MGKLKIEIFSNYLKEELERKEKGLKKFNEEREEKKKNNVYFVERLFRNKKEGYKNAK